MTNRVRELTIKVVTRFVSGQSDLVSKEEAEAIAHDFLYQVMRMEGGISEPSLKGELWVFPLRVGYAGTPDSEPILVNRITGKATYRGLTELDLADPH